MSNKIRIYNYSIASAWTVAMLIIAVAFFFLPSKGIAQEKTVVQGTIFESESELPLAGAHILIHETSYGTIAGPDGSFRLLITDFPVVLKVSHIGFEDRYFTVTRDIKDEEIMLGLNFSAELLEGVTITDEKVELIFKDPSYSVLDFEFHENGLMLLIYRNRLKRSELVLLSTMNDTLATLSKIPGKANSLHRDCKEFIHYLAEDTAYQIHFSGEELNLIHPIHLKYFMPVAEAFKAYHNDYYYFSIKKMQEQVIDYIKYDSAKRNYTSFRVIADKATLQILKDNPIHFVLLNNLLDGRREFSTLQIGSDVSMANQIRACSLNRITSIEAHYLKSCVYTPLYAPLFKSGNDIIIFNHPNSQLEFLTPEGEIIKKVSIDYHQKNNWADLILKDEIREEYYALFLNSNRAYLHRINTNTGISEEANILHYPFVKKILIRNGYAYFTYHQPGSMDRTMLFRQKLKLDNDEYARSAQY
jgi:hypothetical protein